MGHSDKSKISPINTPKHNTDLEDASNGLNESPEQPKNDEIDQIDPKIEKAAFGKKSKGTKIEAAKTLQEAEGSNGRAQGTNKSSKNAPDSADLPSEGNLKKIRRRLSRQDSNGSRRRFRSPASVRSRRTGGSVKIRVSSVSRKFEEDNENQSDQASTKPLNVRKSAFKPKDLPQASRKSLKPPESDKKSKNSQNRKNHNSGQIDSDLEIPALQRKLTPLDGGILGVDISISSIEGLQGAENPTNQKSALDAIELNLKSPQVQGGFLKKLDSGEASGRLLKPDRVARKGSVASGGSGGARKETPRERRKRELKKLNLKALKGLGGGEGKGKAEKGVNDGGGMIEVVKAVDNGNEANEVAGEGIVAPGGDNLGGNVEIEKIGKIENIEKNAISGGFEQTDRAKEAKQGVDKPSEALESAREPEEDPEAKFTGAFNLDDFESMHSQSQSLSQLNSIMDSARLAIDSERSTNPQNFFLPQNHQISQNPSQSPIEELNGPFLTNTRPEEPKPATEEPQKAQKPPEIQVTKPTQKSLKKAQNAQNEEKTDSQAWDPFSYSQDNPQSHPSLDNIQDFPSVSKIEENSVQFENFDAKFSFEPSPLTTGVKTNFADFEFGGGVFGGVESENGQAGGPGGAQEVKKGLKKGASMMKKKSSLLVVSSDRKVETGGKKVLEGSGGGLGARNEPKPKISKFEKIGKVGKSKGSGSVEGVGVHAGDVFGGAGDEGSDMETDFNTEMFNFNNDQKVDFGRDLGDEGEEEKQMEPSDDVSELGGLADLKNLKKNSKIESVKKVEIKVIEAISEPQTNLLVAEIDSGDLGDTQKPQISDFEKNFNFPKSLENSLENIIKSTNAGPDDGSEVPMITISPEKTPKLQKPEFLKTLKIEEKIAPNSSNPTPRSLRAQNELEIKISSVEERLKASEMYIDTPIPTRTEIEVLASQKQKQPDIIPSLPKSAKKTPKKAKKSPKNQLKISLPKPTENPQSTDRTGESVSIDEVSGRKQPSDRSLGLDLVSEENQKVKKIMKKESIGAQIEAFGFEGSPEKPSKSPENDTISPDKEFGFSSPGDNWGESKTKDDIWAVNEDNSWNDNSQSIVLESLDDLNKTNKMDDFFADL